MWSHGCEILETQVIDNYSHCTFFKVDTLAGTNISCEEPQGVILELVITKELYVSPFPLFKDIIVSCKPDLLIEGPYEDPYY